MCLGLFWGVLVQHFFTILILSSLALSSAFATPPDFNNPGGMWMPQQMPENAAVLRQLGIQIDPNELADPASKLMKAIISLGYCSGTFISASGLIITNHHCAAKMLSYLGQQDKDEKGIESDYIRDGFIAHSPKQERHGGPTERVYITQKFVDVTSQVRDGIEKISDDKARFDEIEKRTKTLVAEAEKGRPEIRATVKSFFEGEQYFLIEQLELKDVRLVYAPPKSIGVFGGDDDNWQWPRHTGDFAVLRAYVGKDGKPAAYSPENVPYKPSEHIKVSAKGLKPGDLVMVAGYPGSTSRYATASKIRFDVDRGIPYYLDTFNALVSLMDKMGKENETLHQKMESTRQSFMNSLQNKTSALESLKRIDLATQKEAAEKEFRTWLAADPARTQKYGDFFGEMDQIAAESRKGYEGKFLNRITMYTAELVSSALKIVRMAEERAKPDEERDPAYQKRNWERIRQSEQSAQLSYAREIDLNLTTLMIERALALPESERPEFLSALIDVEKLKHGESVRAQLESLYAATKLESLEERLKLLDTATTEELKASSDPLIQAAVRLRPIDKANEDSTKALAGKLSLVMPRYIKALREFKAAPMAPDANSTLRVTFGRVQGYDDRKSERFYHPFTTVSQMIEKSKKHDLAEWYDPPANVFQAAAEGRTGLYADASTGDIALNFLADTDTTGGNSGSGVLDANGHLVGLLFDGTAQALYSDWLFNEDVRSIHLDVRYALWLMHEVYGLEGLVKEMDIQYPNCNDLLLGSKRHKK
jgi:hypothetical protein